MNAKSDDFDEPTLVLGKSSRAGRTRNDGAPRQAARALTSTWPTDEHERTTARAFAIPDYQEDERGDDEEPERLRRTPRSSSPELMSAELLARLGCRVAEHSYDELEIEEVDAAASGDPGDPSDEASARAFDGVPSGGPPSGAFGGSFGESIDIEIHGGEGSDEDDEDDEDELFADEAERAETDELGDETDEDASWWLRIDASSLGDLPIPVDDVDLPLPPGVIAGIAGAHGALDRRLLDALESPTEVQCSCGHDCDQREHALIALFRDLSANESRTLHFRLTLARQEDAAARAFASLPRDHRTRMLDLLDRHARHQVAIGPNWRVIRKS